MFYFDIYVVLMCFFVDNFDSFENIFEKWVFEVRYFCLFVLIILVVNKKDLRYNESVKKELVIYKWVLILSEEGLVMCERIKVYVYLECLVRMREGVWDVFEMVVRVVFRLKLYKFCLLW